MLGLLAHASLAQAEDPIHSIRLTPQRDFAIVMGEALALEIRVAVAAGLTLESASLPKSGSAVNDVLELRESAWSQQSQLSQTVYTIKLVYQVFQGVKTAETVQVPGFGLRFDRGKEVIEVQTPAWTFTLTPMIPPQTSDEQLQVRADLPPPLDEADAPWRWLGAGVAGLAGLRLYAAWCLGLPPFRFKAAPFTHAYQGVRRLRKAPQAERWREGVKLVHQALNETAGVTLFISQLPTFLAAQPQLAGLKPELEQFFALSDRLFFAGASEPPGDYPWTRLEALCRQLAAGQRR